MKVYILSTYEEHGAKLVKATTDPAKLPEILHSYEAEFESVAEEMKRLVELWKDGWPISDHGYGLSKAWGGLQLHIVELQ